MKLIYSVNGRSISDHMAESCALTLMDLDIHVCTENVVHAVRALIKEGKLPHDEILFVYKDPQGNIIESQYSNKDGSLQMWPDGFCDTHMNFLLRLVG